MGLRISPLRSVPLCFVLLLQFCSYLAPAATDIYIDQATGSNTTATLGTADDPFKSITYAMQIMSSRGAPDPWSVHVHEGIYDEFVNDPADEPEAFPIQLRPGMTLQGDDGPSSCVLNGYSDVPTTDPIIVGTNVSGVTLRGLTFRDRTRSGPGGAAYLASTSATIDRCSFLHNTAIWTKSGYGGGGLYLNATSNPSQFQVTNCVFEDNEATMTKLNYAYGGGLMVVGSAVQTNITSNTFFANHAWYGGGFFAEGNTSGTISENTFDSNTGIGSGCYIDQFTGQITDNVFLRNRMGLISYNISGRVSRNVFSMCSFEGCELISQTDSCRFEQNSFSNNGFAPIRCNNNGGGTDLSNNLFVIDGAMTLNPGITENNTFSQVGRNGPAINISYPFYGQPSPQLRNNIFDHCDIGISVNSSTPLFIVNNDFSSSSLEPFGDDIELGELLLPDCSNNYTYSAGFRGEGVTSGTWTLPQVYEAAENESCFTDMVQEWKEDQWAGALLNISGSTTDPLSFPIVKNTSHQLFVHGNLLNVDLQTNRHYIIDDYRLTTSSLNVDKGGASGLSNDFIGAPRTQGGSCDLGAFEVTAELLKPAPAGVTATKGVYADRVAIAWQPITTATAYEIWVSTDPDANASVLIGATSSSVEAAYDDHPSSVTHTFYWVRALYGIERSGFGAPADGWLAAAEPAQDFYVSPENGSNTIQTMGTLEDPFKSITYAMATEGSRQATNPWTVHLKAGTCSGSSDVAVRSREFYPIIPRDSMTIHGDDGSTSCVISGLGADAPIIASDQNNIELSDITVSDSNWFPPNQYYHPNPGIDFYGSSARLIRCTFVNLHQMFLQPWSTGSFSIVANLFQNTSLYIEHEFPYDEGSLTTTLTDNTFIGAPYAAVYVDNYFVGDILRNTLVSNASGLQVSSLTGNVNRNLSIGGWNFLLLHNQCSGNISENVAALTSGTACSLDNQTGVLSRNFFSRSRSAIWDNHSDTSIDNNLFIHCGGGLNSTTSSIIYRYTSNRIACNTIVGNGFPNTGAAIDFGVPGRTDVFGNIFANLGTAFADRSETISHYDDGSTTASLYNNDFFDVATIYSNKKVAYSNNLAYLASQLSNFHDNHNWIPGFIGEVIDAGTLTGAPIYNSGLNQTSLKDDSKHWIVNGWAGAVIDIATAEYEHLELPILSNTEDSLNVLGNLSLGPAVSGDSYVLNDYRLSTTSPNIDAGSPITLSPDFIGTARPQGVTNDIGAFEFVGTPVRQAIDDNDFSSIDVAPPGSPTGWSTLGMQLGGFAASAFDPDAGAVICSVAAIPAGAPLRSRITGFMSNASEWLPYSVVGSDNFVRAKYYAYAGGQSNPSQLNSIPNLRLRAANRFAVSSILEVLHHDNLDPGNASISEELRPNSVPDAPSLYRVDFDPVDVPYLSSGVTTEGIMIGFEAYALDPQDNGYVALTESVLGTYPTTWLPDAAQPAKVYAPSTSDAGDFKFFATDAELAVVTLIPSTEIGGFAAIDTSGLPRPQYEEGAFGVTLSTLDVLTTTIGVASKEFYAGSNLAQRVRVAEGKQYKVRFHVTSTQQSNLNAKLRLRAHSVKFAWTNKLEIGGAWATGGSGPPVGNNAIAQQVLPGVGCMNPDKNPADITGGWYTLLMNSPLSEDVRSEFPAGTPLTSRMPNLTAQPEPGASAPSARDLKLAFDVIDGISNGANANLEAGTFTLDRAEVRIYPAISD